MIELHDFHDKIQSFFHSIKVSQVIKQKIQPFEVKARESYTPQNL